MSETDTSFTSVLLPGASIIMFANDAESVESFKALQSDWRFARVSMEHRQGGVEEATEALKGGMKSPDLLIIETATIDEGFTARLETLSSYCQEGTAAIVVGPVNDVNLYRRLIGMGISDYLVRPVKLETLSFDIARTLIERLGTSGSRLIGVIGSKGGVGVTVLAEAMAWGAADIMNQKTALIDAAGGWSTLSVGMNFEPATTLAEAVRAAATGNEDAFNRMLFQAHERLHVLSSGGDVMLEDTVDPSGYETLIDKLMTTYPIVLVDLSDAPTSLKRIIINRAHQVVLVTTPLLPALRAARTLINEIKDMRADASSCLELVVNMSGFAPKLEVGTKDLEQALERKPTVTIDYDSALIVGAESDGRHLHSSSEGGVIVRSLLAMMSKVVDAKGADIAAAGQDDKGKKNPLNSILGKIKSKG